MIVDASCSPEKIGVSIRRGSLRRKRGIVFFVEEGRVRLVVLWFAVMSSTDVPLITHATPYNISPDRYVLRQRLFSSAMLLKWSIRFPHHHRAQYMVVYHCTGFMEEVCEREWDNNDDDAPNHSTLLLLFLHYSNTTETHFPLLCTKSIRSHEFNCFNFFNTQL